MMKGIEGVFILMLAVAGGAWDWDLSNLIAAVAVFLIAIGNTVAAFMFFMKWNTSLALVRQDLGGFKKEMSDFKTEIREDMRAVIDRLDKVTERAAVVAAIEARLMTAERRIERIEGHGG